MYHEARVVEIGTRAALTVCMVSSFSEDSSARFVALPSQS